MHYKFEWKFKHVRFVYSFLYIFRKFQLYLLIFLFRFSISEINPYLLLCGAPMLSNNSLSKLGITCIISASPELPVIPVPSSVKLHHTVNVMDSVESDLSSHFDIVADIIHKVW